MTENVKSESGVYSDEDIARIIALWEEGIAVKDIALELGRKLESVRNKVRSLQKKGLIEIRNNVMGLPEHFVEHTAGAYGLPIEWVEHFKTLFVGGQEKLIAGINGCCEAWIAQNGRCLYLSDRIVLTPDSEPSGAVAMYDDTGRVVLVCKAIAHTRNTLSHNVFISVCRQIAENFAHK